jgi:hypothetical protein
MAAPTNTALVRKSLPTRSHPHMALNVIHGAAKVWSLSDQWRTNCAVGYDRLCSVW